jgi:hypothetical protein
MAEYTFTYMQIQMMVRCFLEVNDVRAECEDDLDFRFNGERKKVLQQMGS